MAPANTQHFTAAWDRLTNMTDGIAPLGSEHFSARLDALRELMREAGASVCYLHAGTNLYYLTGLKWNPSERVVAALVFADGGLQYVAPRFELDTLHDYCLLPADVACWEEHESPYQLIQRLIGESADRSTASIWIDPVTPFFVVEGLRVALTANGTQFCSAQGPIDRLRSCKSSAELALIQRSHEMTARVIEAARSILRPGISTSDVVRFINEAHRRVGADGSYFCIVLFGVATSFPHGVKNPQILQERDWVLIDTGCLLQGYHSDITRTFAWGTPTAEQQAAWEVERLAQAAGFTAAIVGAPCEACDTAARQALMAAGYGPDYRLPGLPHRTGHGCGLDIHEAPYLVRGNQLPLRPGMVFSCEPMLVIPGQFGVRLEDHFYITESGPRWFTQPAASMDELFPR